MDKSFTERLDGLKDGEINGSALKESAKGGGRHTTNGNETDLTAIPMHSFSNGEDDQTDLEIIALHPSGQQLDDGKMTASYLVEGRNFYSLK